MFTPRDMCQSHASHLVRSDQQRQSNKKNQTGAALRNNHDRLTCLFCQSIDERKGSPDKTISWTLPDKTINSSSGGSRTTGNPHPHRQRAPSTEPTQSSAVCSNNNNNPSCFVWRVFLAARVSRACLGIINRACFQRKETEKETRENGRAGGPFLDSNISFFLVSRFFLIFLVSTHLYSISSP